MKIVLRTGASLPKYMQLVIRAISLLISNTMVFKTFFFALNLLVGLKGPKSSLWAHWMAFSHGSSIYLLNE